MINWKTGSEMNEITPIVIVYLNSFLPSYAIKNIRYIEKTFPDREIIVLVKEEKYKKQERYFSRVKFTLPAGLDSEILELRFLTSHQRAFRNDFWNVTIVRFFALEKMMLEWSLDSIFHIEADVLVAPYFPFGKIEKLREKIAFPQVSDNSASGSVFYVNGVSLLQEMNLFFKQELKSDPELTDMTLLSRYSRAFKDSYFSLFSGLHTASATSSDVFDAATFGIYLTGGDPRNSRGWIEFYKDVEDHFVKPSTYNFSFSADNKIIASINDSEYVIQNLHIHSKNPKYFSLSWPSKKLSLQIKNSTRATSKEFSARAFCVLAQGFITRRIKLLLRA